MIQLKNSEQIKAMMAAGRITGEALLRARAAVRPGISTWELDRLVRERLERAGATPAGALTVSFRDRYSVRNYLTYGDIMNWIFSLSMFSMLTTTGGQLTCLEVSGFWPLTSVRMAFSMHL